MLLKIFHSSLLFLILTSCQNDNDNTGGDTTAKIYVEDIIITGDNITSGIYSQMTAVISPASATDKSLVWSSSDTSIAQVSSSGLVTALKNGTVTITAIA